MIPGVSVPVAVRFRLLSVQVLGGDLKMWDLSESELLLTISELSVAFAGFASLASILGRRMSKDDPRLDAGRLLNMLTVSLSLTVLALVPFLPMLLE